MLSGWRSTYPSKKCAKVSWDDDIPNLWKNKSHVPNHQPVMIIISLFIIPLGNDDDIWLLASVKPFLFVFSLCSSSYIIIVMFSLDWLSERGWFICCSDQYYGHDHAHHNCHFSSSSNCGTISNVIRERCPW